MKKATGIAMVFTLCAMIMMPALANAENGRITFFQGEFEKGEWSGSFYISPRATDLSIKVENGTVRVTSALIVIDGKQIFKQSDFNQDVGELKKTLVGFVGALPISVTVNGNKAATMSVEITGVIGSTFPRNLTGITTFPGR
ncbi:MAG: hypothetical protein P1S46_07400 [bacterium]|nr:hypothetical protein [bacterium]